MIACLDLEGVLVPEIWINVAEKTGIAELRLTTRDIPDYDVLMKRRLQILEQHHLKLQDIQDVIATMQPLEGAKEFLHWLQSEFQVIILSDTFYQFAAPLMKQLHFPTLFCHYLKVDKAGKIVDYQLRLKDQKRESVKKLRDLNFKIAAAGDSYNDIGMLEEADVGILFCPPEKIVKEYPQFQVTKDYGELKAAFENAMRHFTKGPQ
ncbi:MAG: bifunctional phosphoserine phosphatase/homoserine phosphotransferase ThrH [Deltaproteobacteria bacterium]|nr:bifunctional phosphoserine phosphatase/homoserine phosphotransferase ThrH [Deltaproteobacteria bacterium]